MIPDLRAVTPSQKDVRDIPALNTLKALLGPSEAVLLPADHGTKVVRLNRWPSFTYEDTQSPEYQALLLRTNIGVRLGTPSGHLCVIDCDSPEAVEQMLALNPCLQDTLTTSGRPELRSFWVRCTGEYPEKTLQENGFMEWRSGSAYCIIDGIHPDTREPYQIRTKAKPMEIEFSALKWPPKFRVKLDSHSPTTKGPKKQGTKETGNQRNSFFSPSLAEEELTKLKLHFAGLGHKLKTQAEHLLSAYFQHLERKFRLGPCTRHDTVVSFTLMGISLCCPELIKDFLKIWHQRTKHIGKWKTPLKEHNYEVTTRIETLISNYPDLKEIIPAFNDAERAIYASLRDEFERTAFRRFRNLGIQLPTAKGDKVDGIFYQPRAHLAAMLLSSEKKAGNILGRFIDLGILEIVERGHSYSSGKPPKATYYRYLL